MRQRRAGALRAGDGAYDGGHGDLRSKAEKVFRRAYETGHTRHVLRRLWTKEEE
jgi:hypothetical protein